MRAGNRARMNNNDKTNNNINDNCYSELIIYPEYDARILRNYDYRVTVSRRDSTYILPIYDHTAAEATGRMSCGADCHRRFCEFAFKASDSRNSRNGHPDQVRIDIEALFDGNPDIRSYVVFPSCRKIRSQIRGNVISVYLDKPEYFAVKLNRDENTMLRIFADEPEDSKTMPSGDDPSVLRVEGWYEPESAQVVLDENLKTVYLAPGSVLCSRVRVEGRGSSFLGRGIVLDPYSNIFKHDLRNKVQKHFFEVVSRDLSVRDVKLIDGRGFNITMGTDITGGGDCGGCTFENVKVLSSVICTDGFSFWGVNHVKIRNCFIECGDNALVISLGSSDISVEDTYIGTLCKAIVPTYNVGDNITIRNIYVFRAAEGLFSHFTSRKQSVVTHGVKILVENLNAMDCDDFPWIFNNYNTGTYEKYITFRNIAVPVCVGNSVVESPEKSSLAIRIGNLPQFMYTENYNIVFENLFVGGCLINSYTAPGSAAAVPSLSDGLIIGEIDRNNKVVFKADKAAESEFIAGRDEILVQNDDVSDIKNLLDEGLRYKSIWQETTAYRVDLSARLICAGNAEYHLSIYGSGKQPGMNCQIGKILRKNGRGIYKLEFDVRLTDKAILAAETQFAADFKAAVIGRCKKKELSCAFSISDTLDKWQHISISFDFSDWNYYEHKTIELNISKNTADDADLLLKGFCLYYTLSSI